MKKVAEFISKLANTIAPGVDWANISVATYVRYILAALTTINNVLIALGLNPISFSEDRVYVVVSVIVNIVVLLVNTYKDNPTSKEGVVGADVRIALKEYNKDDSVDNDKLIQNIKTLIDNPSATVVLDTDEDEDLAEPEESEDTDEGFDDQEPIDDE